MILMNDEQIKNKENTLLLFYSILITLFILSVFKWIKGRLQADITHTPDHIMNKFVLNDIKCIACILREITIKL